MATDAAVERARSDVRDTHRALTALLERYPETSLCPEAIARFTVAARRVLEDLRFAAVSPSSTREAADDLGSRLLRRAVFATWIWRRSLDRELAGEGVLVQPPVAATRAEVTAWAADFLEFLAAFPDARLRVTRKSLTGLGRPDVFGWARVLRIYARDVESRLAVGERKKE